MTSDVAWARSAPAGAVRELLLSTVFRGLIALYARRTVKGREHLEGLDGPVLFVANHASHMDTPAAAARAAVALAPAHRRGGRGRLLLRQRGAGARGLAGVLHGAGRAPRRARRARPCSSTLLDDGWSLVIYAEGTRSRDGTVGRLRAGAAMLAAERGLPIVPVHVSGTHATMPVGRGWMRRAVGLPAPRRSASRSGRRSTRTRRCTAPR